MKITITETPIADLLVITPRRFGDDRGWFTETYSDEDFAEAGLDYKWVQDNQAYNAKSGVVRGLHFQKPPYAQSKLVRALRGSIYDVAVDLREGSPTKGEWFGIELTAENGKQLLVPRGFAHGYAALTEHAEVAYKCDNGYNKESEGGIHPADKTLAIDWQLGDESEWELSEKDAIQGGVEDALGIF